MGALRQAQNRVSGGPEAFGDFAAGGGNLLLTGDASMLSSGNGRRVREVLERYCVSAEIVPSFYVDSGLRRSLQEHLDDVSSQWSLQADAALSHFMDFSDFFVFPE